MHVCKSIVIIIQARTLKLLLYRKSIEKTCKKLHFTEMGEQGLKRAETLPPAHRLTAIRRHIYFWKYKFNPNIFPQLFKKNIRKRDDKNLFKQQQGDKILLLFPFLCSSF